MQCVLDHLLLSVWQTHDINNAACARPLAIVSLSGERSVCDEKLVWYKWCLNIQLHSMFGVFCDTKNFGCKRTIIIIMVSYVCAMCNSFKKTWLEMNGVHCISVLLAPCDCEVISCRKVSVGSSVCADNTVESVHIQLAARMKNTSETSSVLLSAAPLRERIFCRVICDALFFLCYRVGQGSGMTMTLSVFCSCSVNWACSSLHMYADTVSGLFQSVSLHYLQLFTHTEWHCQCSVLV